jgi:F-type H+-transporting ATPase subunit epsilon
MAKKIRLDIVTPEKVAYSEDVNMVIARATTGDLGILPGHAPLIAALDIWPLRILTDDGEDNISMCGGFIEVQPDKITIVTNCAELPDEIDVARAENAKIRAENRLHGSDGKVDVARAEVALKRAINRLKVVKSNKR